MAKRKGTVSVEEQNTVSPDETLHHKKRVFLSAYSKCGNITKAAEITGIARQTHYDWLETDTDGSYQAAFKRADEEAGDYLEMEARRRAVEGWEEPVYQQGMQVGAVRKYSDTLLMFLMKGQNPEKYKDRVANEHSGKIDSNVTVKRDLTKLSKEELATLEQIISKTANPG